MKFFGVILMICVFKACNSQSSTESSTAVSKTAETTSKKSPSHVIIRLGSKKFPICEGFLIGKNVAVTAAGCVQKYQSSPTILEVVAGLTSTENTASQKNTQARRVSEIKIHPEWGSSQKTRADIAVLKTSRPFYSSEKVDFSPYGDGVPKDRTVQLVGYGESEQMRYEPLEVPSEEECQKLGVYDEQLGKGKFCAKLKNDDFGEAYTAQSFAGAPLTDPNTIYVYGLVPSGGYGVYSNLTYYADWIEDASNVKRTKSIVTQSSQDSTTDTPSTPSTTTTATTTK